MAPIIATCPKNERSWSHREIAYRDSVWHDFCVPKYSDSPILDSFPRFWHASEMMDGLYRLSLFRGFELRSFEMQRFRVHEIPDTPNSDCVGSTDTRSSNDGRSWLYRRIAYRDFLVHESLVSGNSNSPTSDSSGASATCSCQRLYSVQLFPIQRFTGFLLQIWWLRSFPRTPTPALNPCAASPDPTADG